MNTDKRMRTEVLLWGLNDLFSLALISFVIGVHRCESVVEMAFLFSAMKANREIREMPFGRAKGERAIFHLHTRGGFAGS